jgi:hypothetical protein
MDRVPLVAITAQADTERFHKESHQYLDLISLYRPAVKWNAQLVRPQVVPETVRKAFKVTQTEKPGATHLDFPEDVAAAAAPAGLEPLVGPPSSTSATLILPRWPGLSAAADIKSRRHRSFSPFSRTRSGSGFRRWWPVQWTIAKTCG